MSFIYRNQLLPVTALWNSFSSVYKRFDSVWGKQDITYARKLYYYRGKQFINDPKLKRFLKGLGIRWDEFSEQEIDSEIEEIWFYIDPTYVWDGSYAGDSRVGVSTKETTQLVTPTRTEIVEMFNEAFTEGDELVVKVDYGGANKRYISEHELPWTINDVGVVYSSPAESEEHASEIVTTPLNTIEIRNTLNSNPWYYFANARQKPYAKNSDQFQLYNDYNPEMPYGDSLNPSSRILGTTQVSTEQDPLGIFALMGNDNIFERVDNVFNEGYLSSDGKLDGQALKYTYSQKYKYHTMVEDNPLVDDILLWFEKKSVLKIAHRPVFRPVGEYREDISYHTRDTAYKKVLLSMERYLDPVTGKATKEVSNSLFYNGMLRIEESRLMRRRHFTEMIGTSLDTDYKVEKASTWEKVLAVIIIIGAIVVGIMTGGTAFAAGSLIWSSVATGAGYASLILAVGMYGLSMVGGLSAQGLVKMIGAFAEIVGIIAIISGVMAAVENAGKMLAEQTLKEAGKEITKDAVKNEMLKQTLTEQVSALIDQTFDAITSKLTEFVTMDLGDKASFISDGLSTISDGLEMYQDNEQKNLEKELAIMEAEADKNEMEILSNQLKNPAAIYELMEEELHSPDMLSKLDREIQSGIGQNKSFSIWNSNCNSV